MSMFIICQTSTLKLLQTLGKLVAMAGRYVLKRPHLYLLRNDRDDLFDSRDIPLTLDGALTAI